MLQTTVESSNIERVGWNCETLFIGFKNGSSYSYADVPLDTYNQLVEAPSVGKEFHASIRPNFTAERLSSSPFV